MTQEQKIIGAKLGLLELAKQRGTGARVAPTGGIDSGDTRGPE